MKYEYETSTVSRVLPALLAAVAIVTLVALLLAPAASPQKAYAAATNYLTRSSVPNADGSFTLTGHADSSPFKELRIYNGEEDQCGTVTSGVSGKYDFEFLFDVSDYPVGYYKMVGVLESGYEIGLTLYAEGLDTYYETFFASPILEKPAIKRNSDYFSTGYDYVCFRPYFTVPKDSHTQEALYGYIWLQLYDTKTKEWGDKYGPFDSYENLYTEYFKGNKSEGGTKIAANRTYKARVQYRKPTMYNGDETAVEGPYSNEVKIKTGKAAKPAVKSITAKATKVKKTTLITKAHWDIYGKWHPYSEQKIWTTTYKVTVKLKKKPGTKGIYIGDVKCKGNKLKYTATFTDSGKLKGKKIKFGICTYNDDKLGAYGKAYKKKVKIK